MSVDKLMDWKDTRSFVKENGFDVFIEMMEMEYSCSFFSCSSYWLEDPNYICKLKGGVRDLIIGWYGFHE